MCSHINALTAFPDAEWPLKLPDLAPNRDRELSPISLGPQRPPFELMETYNPAMKSCRLEFKRFAGGELKTYHNWRK